MIDPETKRYLIEAGGLIGAAIITAAPAHFRGKRSNANTVSLEKKVDKGFVAVNDGFTGVNSRIDQLFAFVIGPDGENGLRGDVRAIKDRLDTRDAEERQALRDKVGQLDRRAAV